MKWRKTEVKEERKGKKYSKKELEKGEGGLKKEEREVGGKRNQRGSRMEVKGKEEVEMKRRQQTNKRAKNRKE